MKIAFQIYFLIMYHSTGSVFPVRLFVFQFVTLQHGNILSIPYNTVTVDSSIIGVKTLNQQVIILT